MFSAQVRLERWGDSLAVRIPQELINKAQLTQDALVNLEVGETGLRLTPQQAPSYELDELLAGMTPDQLHSAVDTGQPVGKEVWA